MWTKSNTSFSKFIRFLTGEDCSHFSFAFMNDGIVFESNLLGTHPTFLQTTLKTHTVMHELDLEISESVYNSVWDKVINMFDGRNYDYLGAMYLGIYKLKRKIFGSPIPNSNKWQSDNKFFCDEVYDALNEIPQLPVVNVSGSMMSPHDVWLRVSQGVKK